MALAANLRAGKTIYSAWCTLASPIVAELIAREGFAAVTLDQQHGLFDTSTTASAIAGIIGADAAPFVRIPVGDFAGASRALDFGAQGIIAPMINTVEEAQAFADAVKYPPIGERSWGAHRAMSLMGIADQKDYLANANSFTLALAMVETRTALKNLELILKTRGIDGVFVGPSDLSIALSNGTVIEPESPDIDRELERVAKLAKKAGKIAGAYCSSAERARELAGRGFQLIAIGSDTALLRSAAASTIRRLSAAAPQGAGVVT